MRNEVQKLNNLPKAMQLKQQIPNTYFSYFVYHFRIKRISATAIIHEIL